MKLRIANYKKKLKETFVDIDNKFVDIKMRFFISESRMKIIIFDI